MHDDCNLQMIRKTPRAEPAAPILVVPAAGLGTRMRHVLPGVPKELLPIGGKPAIQHALAMGRDAGCLRAVVVLHPDKQTIARWLRDPKPDSLYTQAAAQEMQELNQAMDIAMIRQPEPQGEADAIALCRNLVQDGVMAVAYPDNIHLPESPGGPGALRALRQALAGLGADPAGSGVDMIGLMDPGSANAGVSDSGRVDLAPVPGSLPRIRDFLPKGEGPFVKRFPDELRTCGIYLALPHFFDFIEQARAAMGRPGPGNELTDGKVRRLMLRAGVTFYGAPLPGQVFDVGNPQGYALCRAYVDSL